MSSDFPRASINGHNILVLGLGASGLAASELALRHGAKVTVLDSDSGGNLAERTARLKNRGADVHLDWSEIDYPGDLDLAVISPGISPAGILGRLARRLACPIVDELEFGFWFCSCPILAVTGTNGKTTTVEMTVHSLKGAGKNVIGAGNIGLPLSEAVHKSSGLDLIVAEVSSFQLEHIRSFHPLGACILNISDDHGDRYQSRDEYLAAKLLLLRNMSNPASVVMSAALFADDRVRRLPLFRRRKPILLATDAAGEDIDWFVDADGFLCSGGRCPMQLLHRSDLKLKGRHNIENVLAALAMCRIAGVAPAAAVPGVRRFAPSGHRLELVSIFNNVRFVNDSKATNPDALVQALETCGEESSADQGKILLIAGGRDKNMNFKTVIPSIRRFVKQVYLIGEVKDTLAELWGRYVSCKKYASIGGVIDDVMEVAAAGDTVLLSPGCASHDMFSDYAERGNVFTHEIKRRTGE